MKKLILITIFILKSTLALAQAAQDFNSYEEAVEFQQKLGLNLVEDYTEVDQRLISIWQEKYPEIFERFLALNKADQKFVSVFRGIDNRNKVINLNHYGDRGYGPYVYTSLNPLVSVIYAAEGSLFKFRVPFGFFIKGHMNEIQLLIDSTMPEANMNAFLVEKGSLNRAKFSKALMSSERATNMRVLRYLSFKMLYAGP